MAERLPFGSRDCAAVRRNCALCRQGEACMTCVCLRMIVLRGRTPTRRESLCGAQIVVGGVPLNADPMRDNPPSSERLRLRSRGFRSRKRLRSVPAGGSVHDLRCLRMIVLRGRTPTRRESLCGAQIVVGGVPLNADPMRDNPPSSERLRLRSRGFRSRKRLRSVGKAGQARRSCQTSDRAVGSCRRPFPPRAPRRGCRRRVRSRG